MSNRSTYGKARAFTAWLAIPLISMGLTGCHHFFGNDDQTTDPLQFKDQGLSCVRSVGQDLGGFFSGGPQDPVQIVDCLSGALAKFASSTRGASPDGWTRGELSSFFETYFRAESETGATPETAAAESVTETDASVAKPAPSTTPASATPAIATEVKSEAASNTNNMRPFDAGWVAQAKRRAVVGELFKWKSTLLGGGDQTLSRTEMDRIRAFLTRIRVPLAAWRGRGAVLALQSSAITSPSEPLSASDLEKLITAIREVSSALVEELRWSGAEIKQPRESMKFETMAQSLEKSGIKSLSTPERQELAKVVKALAVAGEPTSISGGEWPLLVNQATELWIAGIRLSHNSQVGGAGRDVEVLDRLIADLAVVLQKTVDRHGGRVETDLLKKLIIQLEANKILPAMFKARSLNASMDVILGKLLAGNSHPQKAELVRGFMREHVQKLDQIARDWLEGERVATEIAGPASFASLNQARVTMSQIATKSRDQIGAAARAQMSDLILRGRPLVHDLQGRLLILPEDQIPGFRKSDLTKLNLSRTLTNAILRAYAHEPARAGAMPQITDVEAQEAFLDLKSIGRDAGIMDVRSLQSGTRTFMEAGIFLSVSDGNQFISMHEGVEWFSTVASAGRVADQIHSDLVAACGTIPPDVFGKQRLKAKCFRDGALVVMRTRFSHLPNVVRAINQSERDRTFPAFFRALENAARPLGENDLSIESTELRAMSPILHYAESLFARHDTNRSSLLDQPEVWGIFPLIQPFIRSMAGGTELSQGEERAIYSWLLNYGEPPETTVSGITKLKLYQARMAMGLTTERANIRDVVTILASFNQVGRAKKNRDVVAYYQEHAKEWEAGIARSDRKTFETTRALFQCAAEADVDLARVFLARRTEIFAVDRKLDEDEQAQEFLKRTKTAIQSDPQLQLLCGAF